MNEFEEDMFELTEQQQKAFNALKKAIAACKKSNLLMYNNYGTLGVCDRARIVAYNDNPSDYQHSNGSGIENPNEVELPCNEWADDTHYFHLALQ